MIAKPKNRSQGSLFFELKDQLNQKNPLYQLAEKIHWSVFEEAFKPLYCPENGRPAKPIRLMVGVLILKHLRNVSDESVVEQWAETAFIDSTVQEKNITCPTDAKLHRKIIKACQQIAIAEKLPVPLFSRVLAQTRYTKNKVYSLHEPDAQCISKGKEHKKYEFGNKVSVVCSVRGVILGAASFRNQYDGHTIDAALAQVKRLTGSVPELLAGDRGDRGYRGQRESGKTKIVIPSAPLKLDSRYARAKKRKLFCSRAGIEPRIGHLKSDHRLGRNFYKGLLGDAINVLLAAAAFNFKRALRVLCALIRTLLQIEFRILLRG